MRIWQRRIPVILGTCGECGAHYDEHELKRLDVKSDDRFNRYTCAVCGATFVQSHEVLREMSGATWAPEDYAILSPADAGRRQGVLELTELGATLLIFAFFALFCGVVVWAIASVEW